MVSKSNPMDINGNGNDNNGNAVLKESLRDTAWWRVAEQRGLDPYILHMALKGKAKSASLTMGMPQDAVNRLPELPLEKISILASSGMLCFSSRLSEKFWRKLQNTEMDEELPRLGFC